jgi:hypothetical protein
VAVEFTVALPAEGCPEIVGDPGGELVVTSDLLDSAESKYVDPSPMAVIETLYAVESARDARFAVVIVALVPVRPVRPVVAISVPPEL